MSPPRTFMFVAGETSGDLLATELIEALRQELSTSGNANAGSPTVFFGAGGPRMAEAGVELAFDLTQHAVIGIWDVLTNLLKFRRLMDNLVQLALTRRPEVIVCVDFSGFNRRLGQAIRQRQSEVPGWRPAIVQFVSPQVWASRPGRATQMARDFDLLLSIFPFEKAWYATHAPAMRVEFVGHPMIDRFSVKPITPPPASSPARSGKSSVLLLPGSRVGELRRHLPVMLGAAALLQSTYDLSFRLVLPDDRLLALARDLCRGMGELQVQVGGLASALSESTIALASTGTVTMECAFFGVPTVTLYKTNWLTYELGRRIVTVKSLTMPNLLAGKTVFPEFIQHAATPANLAAAAGDLLGQPEHQTQIKEQLKSIVRSLGEHGACRRAAAHIVALRR